jgi:starch synthase
MKIVHISAECYPLAKVGGLADVVGALPKYQNKFGEDTSVIIPFYNIPTTQRYTFEIILESEIHLGTKKQRFRVLKLSDLAIGFPVFAIDVPSLIFKDFVYSANDTERFIAFQIAALQWLQSNKVKPEVLHCHDHHTGLVPFMMEYCKMFADLKGIPTVLTIHNAQYQGSFSHDKRHLLPNFDMEKVGLLDWDGNINPLAAAIKCAWLVTTVSPSYMEELKVSANGLETLLANEHQKCIGILNGIDSQVWNPETDQFIAKQYGINTVISGKKANKKILCDRFNLDSKKPLFAFIGRLVIEKGSDLFPESFDIALKNNEINILLLGSGEKDTEKKLQALKQKHQGRYNAYIGYDEKLSHSIYAGADFLLMPSRVEPCGLNQLYSLRYGTVPIVRNIGGLKDTVIDINKAGFGITHEETSVASICKAISRGVKFYAQHKIFRKNLKRLMKIDHSWEVSATQYVQLYTSLKN